MQGHPQVIETLNALLAAELTATNQYVVHQAMATNWGYARYAQYVMARAKVEMRHADALIDRVLFLNGAPRVQDLNVVTIGESVDVQLRLDAASETDAISQYRAAIRLCLEVADDGTRTLLESILKDEEQHLNDIEAQQAQIQQMGLQQFLSEQT